MGAIFLSYAREDRDCAERLADVIGKAGHDVWWDRRLDGGEEFSDEIVAALDKSDVVLVAWSQESVRSRWVRDEASVGCEKGGLLPVTIDGSQPPMGFRQFHTLDLTGWKGSRRDERTSELLHSIDRRLQGKAGRLTAIPPTVKSKRRPPSLKGRGLWIGVAILLLGLALLGGLLFRNAQFESSKPLRPKFALLTFTTTSTDQAMRELASQSRDSIVHAFSQSGVPLRLMDSVPQGESHSVDFVITGDFSRNGDKVLATVRLDEVAHGATVYTQRFEAGTDDIRDLPERIGAQLAGNLTWAAPMLLLDRRRPLDPALLSSLLQDNFSNEDSLQSYQNAKRVAAEAPDFQSTQMSLAFNTAFVLAELPRSERAEAVAEARRAANRGVALGPGFGDAYAMACLLQSETLRLKCEDRLREAKRIDPDAPFVNTFLSHLLEDVGRFDEATELARLAHSHDIYLPTKIGWMLKAMEFSGQSDDAKDLYLKGSRWWPEYKPMFFHNRMFGLIHRGDFNAIPRLEREVGATAVIPGYTESREIVGALNANSVSRAQNACQNNDAYTFNIRCMLILAKLGDQDSAYALAAKLYPRRVGRTAAETEQIWLAEPDLASPEFISSPGAAALRRDPRFFQLAQRIGLVAYWRSGRTPDFCRKNPEPLCPQLLGRN